jgi:hypothetical protein
MAITRQKTLRTRVEQEKRLRSGRYIPVIRNSQRRLNGPVRDRQRRESVRHGPLDTLPLP